LKNKVVILKHVKSEGPGTIKDYLEKESIPFEILELSKGDHLPEKLDDISAVVSLGGPMNVYEEGKYSFLKEENKFIQEIISSKTPFLGICLGAQLLAKTAGAKVYKASAEEIGWFKIDLTADGINDPIFKNVPDKLDVFQWHGDTFNIPNGAALLGKGDRVVNQAFRVGERAYGFQIHLEINATILKKWFVKDLALNDYLKYLLEIKQAYQKIANQIFYNFFSINK
jgi:GMP synthase-like glutamine amidotransferase